MTQNTSEKPRATGFKPFAIIFIVLIVTLVVAKFILDKLL